jgi:hypothetical protein
MCHTVCSVVALMNRADLEQDDSTAGNAIIVPPANAPRPHSGQQAAGDSSGKLNRLHHVVNYASLS